MRPRRSRDSRRSRRPNGRRRRYLRLVFALVVGCGTAGRTHAGCVEFASTGVISNTGSITALVAADIDGDGDIDVVSAVHGTPLIAWHENDGMGGGWTLHTITVPAGSTRSIFAADVDGDGDLDVLEATTLYAYRLAWHENDGTGTTWTLHDGDVLCWSSTVS